MDVLPGWARYIRDWRRYRALPGAEPLRLRDAFPQMIDRTASSPFDAHYFHQDVWAARRIAEAQPARHVDVGSRVDYVGFLTALCPVTFVDIRPLEAHIDRLECVAGSLLDLPFDSQSLPSVSCLHVAEHVGLGRYGDPLDPEGSRRAAAELQRVVAPGGQLLFSGPVGAPRVCFNAHRVHDPVAVVSWFDELELETFAGVDDTGRFRENIRPQDLAGNRYACGLYRLRRPA
jgi:hypothetical protein